MTGSSERLLFRSEWLIECFVSTKRLFICFALIWALIDRRREMDDGLCSGAIVWTGTKSGLVSGEIGDQECSSSTRSRVAILRVDLGLVWNRNKLLKI